MSPSFTFADLPSDLYVESVSNSGAYGDISLVLRYQNPVWADKVKVTVAKAFVAMYHPDYDSEDVIEPIVPMMAALGHGSDVATSVSKPDVIALAPGGLIWYTFSHGLTNNAGVFTALGFEDGPFFPTDVPAGLDYRLVFLNACVSAQEGSPAVQAFIQRFKADVYLGWKGMMNPVHALDFADRFFSRLDGERTVRQAIDDTIDSYLPGDPRRISIEMNIRLCGDENVVVDLVP